MLSRPCRKRRPSAREYGAVSGVSSSCGAPGGFLPRHDENLREPLVRRQGSQVSMRVARASASWLSSRGRGLGPRDALKKDSRGLSRGVAGNPRFPRLLPGNLGNLPCRMLGNVVFYVFLIDSTKSVVPRPSDPLSGNGNQRERV